MQEIGRGVMNVSDEELKNKEMFHTTFSAAVFSMNLDPCPGLPGQVTVNPNAVI